MYGKLRLVGSFGMDSVPLTEGNILTDSEVTSLIITLDPLTSYLHHWTHCIVLLIHLNIGSNI
jgi:hypothetical protein